MEQINICEAELTEQEIYEALASISSNKFPSNDGLTKEFYYTFWNEVKDIFMDSLNGDQICFSNVDQKIVSKAIAAKLKKVLPFLISPGKTAYVDGRFIG